MDSCFIVKRELNRFFNTLISFTIEIEIEGEKNYITIVDPWGYTIIVQLNENCELIKNFRQKKYKINDKKSYWLHFESHLIKQ